MTDLMIEVGAEELKVGDKAFRSDGRQIPEPWTTVQYIRQLNEHDEPAEDIGLYLVILSDGSHYIVPPRSRFWVK